MVAGDGAASSQLPRPGLGFGEHRQRNDEFRQHAGFLALMCVCLACVIYLMGVLRSILRPFLWALFLVMGLTPGVSLVERFLFCTGACVCRCTAVLLQSVCSSVRWICGSCHRCRKCWRRRVLNARLRLQQRGRDFPGAAPTVIGSSSAAVDDSGAEHPPSVASDNTPNDREDGRIDTPAEAKAVGPCARRIVHAVAIAVVVAAVICSIGGFVLLIVQSIVSLQKNWVIYKTGAKKIAESAERLIAHATGSIPAAVADEIASNMLVRAEELISFLVTEVLSNIWRCLFEFLMMALYISFWLANPMPIGNQMLELFKRYIILKGFACLCYGVCVGFLLYVLSVDLAAAFGLAAFLLSFVPEVGAIVAMMLPAPVILFDSRLEAPTVTLTVALAAQLGLKFFFANVVEVKLVEADQLMKMHPVIILLAVAFFGFIWGPTGMLLSVPLVAYLKVALLSDEVPPLYRNPILVILEGDRNAPAKYVRKKPRHLDVAGESDARERDPYVAAATAVGLRPSVPGPPGGARSETSPMTAASSGCDSHSLVAAPD